MPEPLTIVQYPDPRLKKPSARITEFTPGLKELADQMFALMREAKGVGLAAPQVHESVRLAIIEYDAAALARHSDDITALTAVEGLDAHGRAVTIRTRP